MEHRKRNQSKKNEKNSKRDNDLPKSVKSRRRKKWKLRENVKLKKRKRNELVSRYVFTSIAGWKTKFQARQEQKEREQQEKLAKMEEKRTVPKKAGKSKLQRQRELAEEKAKQAQK